MFTKLAIAAVVAAAAVPAAATLNVPVPTNAFITFKGLNWAWANPCAPTGGCGDIDLSYQSTQGWRLPTAADWANAPTANDFLFAGANVPAFGTDSSSGATFFGVNSIDGACASPWFSAFYTHCDFGDGAIGAVFGNPGNPYPGNGNVDTWVVRNAVPEPASWAMLIAGFGLVGAAARRRKVAAVAA